MNEPLTQVREAIARLGSRPAIRVEIRSRLYLTAPLGPQDQPQFVNAVVGVLTHLDARALLTELLDIERAMGRARHERWGPRIIDLDLLWMPGQAIDEPGLTLPHPGLPERNFVLYPLSDIAPTVEIPGQGRVVDLKSRLSDDGISLLD